MFKVQVKQNKHLWHFCVQLGKRTNAIRQENHALHPSVWWKTHLPFLRHLCFQPIHCGGWSMCCKNQPKRRLVQNLPLGLWHSNWYVVAILLECPSSSCQHEMNHCKSVKCICQLSPFYNAKYVITQRLLSKVRTHPFCHWTCRMESQDKIAAWNTRITSSNGFVNKIFKQVEKTVWWRPWMWYLQG